MCFMCKFLGHWVPSCTDGLGTQSSQSALEGYTSASPTSTGSVDSTTTILIGASAIQTSADGSVQWVWQSDYTFVSAANAGPVDVRGVNLVGVGDPDDPYAPDFMASESTLKALATGSSIPGVGPAANSPQTNIDASAQTFGSSDTSTSSVDANTTASSNSATTSSAQVNNGSSGNSGAASTTGSATSTAATQTDGDMWSANDFGADTVLASGSGGSGSGGPTASLTTAQAAAQITRDGYRWGGGIGTTDLAYGPITVGFRVSAPSYSLPNNSAFASFTAAEETVAIAALNYWAAVANVTFTFLGDTSNATILFGNYSANDGAEAFTYLPVPPGTTSSFSSQGDVWVNTNYANTTNIPALGYVYMTLIHETGHALGLEHPSNYNAGQGSITYANNASYIQDDHQYTVMSYFSETNTGGNYKGQYPETPMLDDVAAIQRLYGANMNTATGNDTYGFHSTLAGTVYSITSASQVVVFNVWDAGGTDTFDFSGYSQNQTINLNAESFSSVGGLVDNVSISAGVTIENAVGGSGNDIIIGNSAANNLQGGGGNDTITGGGGNDTIDGGSGTNTAVYSGAFASYAFTPLGNGSFQVSGGPDGTDTLTNIQSLQFSDQTVSAHPYSDQPSTVAVSGPIVVATGGWLEITSLNLPIMVTDPEGDPVVTYRFTDVGTGATSDELWYLGAANNGYLPQGGTVDVPVVQLSGFWVGGGSVKGTDTLQVQVYDGYQWSTAQNITVITDAPPTVTAQTTNFGSSQTVALSSIFSATDADGDSITQYQVSDTSIGGSRLLLNGVQQTENTVFTISAANLNQWSIATASASHNINDFQIAAYDGTAWSAPVTIDVLTGTDSVPVVAAAGPVLLKVSQWLDLGATLNLPVSITDADGDTTVSYRFTDLGSGSNTAQLWYGTGFVAQGGTVTVPAAQLANLWMLGGSAAGADTLAVQVYDGYAWSAAQDITVTTRAINHAPAISVLGTSSGLNQTIAASSVFTASDADGDAIRAYKVTDATAGGARLLLNGIQQAENTPIIVSDLSQLSILTSSVNRSVNAFTVQAYDGLDWSPLATINLTSALPDNPSVVTVNGSFMVAPNNWLDVTPANLPITVSDADGDPVVSYRFTDLTNGANSDYLWFNSNIAQGGSVVVAAGQLSNLWIHGAAGACTDALQVEVYDGYQWSAPQIINVVTHGANHAPVVAAATTTFTLDQTVDASSIFTVSDADGDTIQQYTITQTTANGAQLLVNGTAQPENMPVTVNAADLADVQIVISSANRSVDTFTVQASDGYDWSAVASINVTSANADNQSVVTVTGNIMVTPGGWLDVTSLPITVTDADGDPIVSYRFTDTSSGVSSAYLWFNNAIAQGGTVDVPAAQLSNLWIHGSAANSFDTLHVQVFDGYEWSTAQDITLITHGAEHLPVVTGGTTSLGFDQTVSLASIFNVSDADGDAITQYQVSDATVGGAHLLFNGVQQAENTVFTINAADLSQWQVVTSSVVHDINTFQIAANDGIGWSNAVAVNVASGDNSSVETVTGALQLTPNQWLNFNTSNLPLSISDADGDATAAYRFTDIGTGASSAHLWFNSTVAQGGTVEVAANQLSNLWLQADSSGSIDTLRIQAYDGFAWSAPQDVSVITQPANTPQFTNVVLGGTTGVNDVLSGTAAADTFIFAPNFGNDIVNGYTPGQDVLAIDHTIFATAAAAVGAASDVNGNAVIHVDANDSITLTGVTTATLQQHQSDFHIV